MAEFIARRIHDGYMTWDDLKSKKESFQKAVKVAYDRLYSEESR